MAKINTYITIFYMKYFFQMFRLYYLGKFNTRRKKFKKSLNDSKKNETLVLSCRFIKINLKRKYKRK